MSDDYVLIAEPDGRLARIVASFAQEAGLEACTVREGEEAQKVMRSRGLPVLLVTNLALPRMDGFALVSWLRESAGPGVVPVMALSASMQLRNTAAQRKKALGIAEVAAPGMTASTLRATFSKALASVGRGMFRAPTHSTLRPTKAPLPSRDPVRLERIRSMGLVDDQPPDAELQRIVEQTARSFNVPIALVSLVLEHRQWFKAHVGLGGELLRERGTPIEQAFCRHVVDAEAAQPLVVPDATNHPLFSDNPLVRGGAVGSYAGAPLLTADGKVLGTLCIIDHKPLAIGHADVTELTALARRVAGELELRSKAMVASPSSAPGPALADAYGLDYLSPVLSQLEESIVLMDEGRQIFYANRAFSDLLGVSPGSVIGQTRDWMVERLCTLSDQPEELRARMRVCPEGPFLAREQLELSTPRRRLLRWVARPVRFPERIAQLAMFTDVTLDAEVDDLTFFVEELD